MQTLYPMTPKRRFLSGILGGRVDRTPIASVTSVVNVEQMEITCSFFPDAHLDGEKMARLAAGAFDILGFDAIMPYFSVQAEAGALGCDVDWGDPLNMPVEKKHPWKEPEDVKIPSNFLKSPSIKAVLDAIRILRNKYGEQVAIVGKVMGPWTLAYNTHGTQDFLIKTILEPDKVRKFLDRLKEITLLFGIAQIHAGADVICLADHATGDLVSPKTYRDFLLPYHQELTKRLGCPTVLHIYGNTFDRLDDICSSGFDAFHFDSKVDAKKAVEKVAKRISLVGNINNPQVLLNSNPDEVEERTRYAIAAGVDVVGPECAIPMQTPLANLLAISHAARFD
jgi:MtaA/CmuA family methyltransferase